MNEQEIKELFNIIDIPENRSYWLIRAGREGKYFEEFRTRNFTGISWDKVDSIEDISHLNKEDLKDYVQSKYPEIERIGNISNKIFNFINEVKDGDIVIMPSTKREKIAFGIVEGDAYLDDSLILEDSLEGVDENGIPNKRRRVKWVKVVRSEEVHSRLILNLFSPHSISAITDDKVKELIDIHVSDLFTKSEKGFIVFNVKTEKNIGLGDLSNYLSIFGELEKFYNSKESNDEKLVIQLNLNSPGKIAISGAVGIIGFTIFMMALMGADFEVNLVGQKLKGKTQGMLEYYKEFNAEKERSHERKMELLKIARELEIKTPENIKNFSLDLEKKDTL